jgi:hypothetical protein
MLCLEPVNREHLHFHQSYSYHSLAQSRPRKQGWVPGYLASYLRNLNLGLVLFVIPCGNIYPFKQQDGALESFPRAHRNPVIPFFQRALRHSIASFRLGPYCHRW